MTTFVGRQEETVALLSLLRDPDVRLLTLTGAPGTGKTRLALQVAQQALPTYSDRVFRVSLTSAADASDALRAVARVLGVVEKGDEALEHALITHLKGRQVLLLFDSCERVTEAGPVVARILTNCLRLKVLVTRRTPLRLSVEREFALSPLPLPVMAHQTDVDALQACPSVALFVERARRASPGFHLTSENAAAVAGVCIRLGGLPLALELAAARTKLLPLQALLAEFERQGASARRMLVGGIRDLSPRHQTLRATLRWSHDLLSHEQRQLFRRLSVFVGGADIDAIYAVGSQATGEDEPDSVMEIGLTLEALTALVDVSLVRREEDTGGQPRFSMLEAIREFALEELSSSGEEPAIRELHARYFLKKMELARSDDPGRGIDPPRVAAEYGNTMAARRWLAACG